VERTNKEPEAEIVKSEYKKNLLSSLQIIIESSSVRAFEANIDFSCAHKRLNFLNRKAKKRKKILDGDGQWQWKLKSIYLYTEFFHIENVVGSGNGKNKENYYRYTQNTFVRHYCAV
jgi:hypothetical protein